MPFRYSACARGVQSPLAVHVVAARLEVAHREEAHSDERCQSLHPVLHRGLAKGILGVAFFQFLTAGTVFVLANVPFPGLWAVAVLVLAMLQLPSVIVILPVIFKYLL